MRMLVIIMLLSIATAGCSNNINYLPEVNNKIDTYVLPKGMKFVSYDNYMGKIIIRKARFNEESETYYVYNINGEYVEKIVERE